MRIRNNASTGKAAASSKGQTGVHGAVLHRYAFTTLCGTTKTAYSNTKPVQMGHANKVTCPELPHHHRLMCLLFDSSKL